MTPGFAVGEIAVCHWDPTSTPDETIRSYDGQDALVIESLGLHSTWEPCGRASNTFGYVVQFSDGTFAVAEPHELRKKQPPGHDEEAARQAMLDFIERAKLPQMAPV